MADDALIDKPWRLTIPESIYEMLYEHLFPGDNDEHGAVIVAGLHHGKGGRTRLLARELFLAREGVDFVPGKRGYRMLKAQFIQRHILTCRDEKLVYLAIHNHGGRDHVDFSSEDLRSHERGYPALLDINAENPVGALVFAHNAIAGDIWLQNGKRVTLECAEIIGRHRRVIRPSPLKPIERVDRMYDRQTRLFGDEGQRIFQNARVAIIGLGGVGSLVAEFLARLGVGSFILVDPDRLEPTNRPRVVGSKRRDVLWGLADARIPKWAKNIIKRLCTLKVKIAQRVIKQANSYANVELFAKNVLDPKAAEALLGCDYIFLAADEMRARLLVNAIGHQYLIPGVQIGSKISADARGNITDIFSVVRPLRPGENCLWCNQLINPSKLADEAKIASERRKQRYVDDPEVAAPSVITLNSIGAAHACNDFVMYMTGLGDKNCTTDFVTFNSRSRLTSFSKPRSDANCSECGCATESRLGHGESGTRLPVFAN